MTAERLDELLVEAGLERGLPPASKGAWSAFLEVLARDLAGLERLKDELAAARDAAEAASRSKSDFLAHMSHEIRTPLNAVIGMTGLLLDATLTPEQRDYVETIRTSGDTLLTLVNDILDLSKMEQGKLELEHHPFVVREVVEESFDLVAPRVGDKDVDLVYQLDDSVPEALWGDVTRLRQVLVNILSNAVKFTAQGEVSLLATGARTDDGRVEVAFAIRDTGIGIPEDRHERVFRSFAQADASTTRVFGGTGLGLAISKRLTELMGGRIWLESAAGAGTTFWFTVLAEEAPLPPRSGLFVGGNHLAGLRLLVVDDGVTSRRALCLMAKAWGVEVRSTGSAAEALDWLARGHPFDAALVDRRMPGTDGLAFAREIRSRRDAGALPLVLLTSVGRRQDDSPTLLFDAVLTRPVKPAQLAGVLAGLRDDSQVRRRRRPAEPAVDRELGLRHPLRILVAEDNAVNQKVALSLLSRLGYRADVVASGFEVLEALERQPYDLILMDVQMPDLDGLAATRRIRQRLSSADVPWVVAMTANAMKGDREACFEAGMNDYVAKPVQLQELADALTRSPRRGKEGETERARQLARPVLDDRALSVLRGLEDEADPDFVESLIRLFLRDTPARLADMAAAGTSGDAAVFRRAAHSLKASAASLGGVRMSDLCARLETLAADPDTLAEAHRRLPEVEAEYAALKAALLAGPSREETAQASG